MQQRSHCTFCQCVSSLLLHACSTCKAPQLTTVQLATRARALRCVCKHGSWEKYYFNPLKCPLPKAPSLKLYCMYGHGMPTERAYSYLNLETPEVGMTCSCS